MMSESMRLFERDLWELVARWREKPKDDRLVGSELAGVMESVKFQLLMGCYAATQCRDVLDNL